MERNFDTFKLVSMLEFSYSHGDFGALASLTKFQNEKKETYFVKNHAVFHKTNNFSSHEV